MIRIGFRKFGTAALAFMMLMSGMVANAEEPVTVSNQPESESVEVLSDETTPYNLPSEAGAAVYTQAMLDAYIRLDPTVAVEQGYISAQQWAENYKTQLEELKKELPYIPEEVLNNLIDAAMNIVSKTNYIAGATRKLEDGSYEVTILYKQMVLDKDEMLGRFLAGMLEWESTLPVDISDIPEEALISALTTIMTNVLNLYCEFPVYTEPATTTVIVTYEDGAYRINEEWYDEMASLVFTLL